jgi:hypothetical protein
MLLEELERLGGLHEAQAARLHEVAGRVFLLANGGYGFECSCGYVLTARSLGSLQAAMTEHTAALASCPFAAARAAAEDEEDFSDL